MLLSFVCSRDRLDTILLVKLDNIGDFVLWLDSAKEYKKHYANQKILLLCSKACKPLAVRLGYFDCVISVDTKRLPFDVPYRLKFLIGMCKNRFSHIINPVYSRDYFVQDILIRALRAKEKIASQGNYNNTTASLRWFGFSKNKQQQITKRLKAQADKYYTRLVPCSDSLIMELTRNAQFIRGLLDKNFKSSLPTLPFKLDKYKGLPFEKYVVLFVGASTKNRVWQANNYAAVINNINKNIVVCGGNSDRWIYEKIKPFLDTAVNVCDLIGVTSLLDLFSVIDKACYVISNDTSAAHISALVHTSSVVLLPGNYYGRFHPYVVELSNKEEEKFLPKVVNKYMQCYNCFNVCPYVKDKNTIWPCIEAISLEDVLEKIKEIENQ